MRARSSSHVNCSSRLPDSSMTGCFLCLALSLSRVRFWKTERFLASGCSGSKFFKTEGNADSLEMALFMVVVSDELCRRWGEMDDSSPETVCHPGVFLPAVIF